MIVFCSDNGPVGDDGYKDGALEFMGIISQRPYKAVNTVFSKVAPGLLSSLGGQEPLSLVFLMKWFVRLI